MTYESVPRTRTESRQHGYNMRQYPAAVTTPAAKIFGYALTAAFGLFESLALLMLWYLDVSLRDAVYWFLIAGTASLFVGGIAWLDAWYMLHGEYHERADTYHERVSTEYRSVKQPTEQGQRPITQTTDGSFKVGRHSFSHRQRRMLARLLTTGDNITHHTLKQVGLLSGDIKAHHNRELANDIQAELIRLGYAELNGRNTQLTQKGHDEWLDNPPTPDDE